RMTAISSSNVLPCTSSVVGDGMAILSRRKISRHFSAFMGSSVAWHCRGRCSADSGRLALLDPVMSGNQQTQADEGAGRQDGQQETLIVRNHMQHKSLGFRPEYQVQA